MKPLFYLLLLFFSAAWPQGQDASSPPRPVVNADIVEMSRAGLAPAVLIAKIKNSQCKFDTSPSALVDQDNGRVLIDVQQVVPLPEGLTTSLRFETKNDEQIALLERDLIVNN